MRVWELIIVAIGLSMDAFAVAICKGLSIKKPTIKYMLFVGLYFGFFQGLMPLIGYFVALQFSDIITGIDHWIAFALLMMIGAKMIYESFKRDSDIIDENRNNKRASLGIGAMLPLALAVSIDALAAGVSFAFLEIQIILAVILIGGITFVVSALGVVMGNAFGTRLKAKAELVGGLILMLMGIKILVEHLFF